jgi:anti-sigma factor (TIGR02949 family)
MALKASPKGKHPMGSIEISCVEVWREISNYLDQEISTELRERMEAHFQACGHCTAVLDGTRNVVQLIGDGRAFPVPEGFSDRLYKRIEALR